MNKSSQQQAPQQQQASQQQASQQQGQGPGREQQAMAMAQKLVQMPPKQADQAFEQIKEQDRSMAAMVMGFSQQMKEMSQGQQAQSQPQAPAGAAQGGKSPGKAQRMPQQGQGAQQASAASKKKKQQAMKKKILGMAKQISRMKEPEQKKQLKQLKRLETQNPQMAKMVQKALEQVKRKEDLKTQSPRESRVNADRRKARKDQQRENVEEDTSTSIHDILRGIEEEGDEVIRSVAKKYYLDKINTEDHLEEVDESTSKLHKIVKNYLESHDDEGEYKKDEDGEKRERAERED